MSDPNLIVQPKSFGITIDQLRGTENKGLPKYVSGADQKQTEYNLALGNLKTCAAKSTRIVLVILALLFAGGSAALIVMGGGPSHFQLFYAGVGSAVISVGMIIGLVIAGVRASLARKKLEELIPQYLATAISNEEILQQMENNDTTVESICNAMRAFTEDQCQKFIMLVHYEYFKEEEDLTGAQKKVLQAFASFPEALKELDLKECDRRFALEMLSHIKDEDLMEMGNSEHGNLLGDLLKKVGPPKDNDERKIIACFPYRVANLVHKNEQFTPEVVSKIYKEMNEEQKKEFIEQLSFELNYYQQVKNTKEQIYVAVLKCLETEEDKKVVNTIKKFQEAEKERQAFIAWVGTQYGAENQILEKAQIEVVKGISRLQSTLKSMDFAGVNRGFALAILENIAPAHYNNQQPHGRLFAKLGELKESEYVLFKKHPLMLAHFVQTNPQVFTPKVVFQIYCKMPEEAGKQFLDQMSKDLSNEKLEKKELKLVARVVWEIQTNKLEERFGKLFSNLSFDEDYDRKWAFEMLNKGFDNLVAQTQKDLVEALFDCVEDPKNEEEYSTFKKYALEYKLGANAFEKFKLAAEQYEPKVVEPISEEKVELSVQPLQEEEKVEESNSDRSAFSEMFPEKFGDNNNNSTVIKNIPSEKKGEESKLETLSKNLSKSQIFDNNNNNNETPPSTLEKGSNLNDELKHFEKKKIFWKEELKNNMQVAVSKCSPLALAYLKQNPDYINTIISDKLYGATESARLDKAIAILEKMGPDVELVIPEIDKTIVFGKKLQMVVLRLIETAAQEIDEARAMLMARFRVFLNKSKIKVPKSQSLEAFQRKSQIYMDKVWVDYNWDQK